VAGYRCGRTGFSETRKWPATTYPPVNFGHLSTGDFGDSAQEFVASNVNPGGSCCTPATHLSKRRLRADNYLQNVWDKGPLRNRWCQPGRRSGWTYRAVAPGEDSNRELDKILKSHKLLILKSH